LRSIACPEMPIPVGWLWLCIFVILSIHVK
jgi:hypothetical protein